MFDGVLRYIKCTLSYWNQRKEETYHCRCIKNDVEWGDPGYYRGPTSTSTAAILINGRSKDSTVTGTELAL